MINDNAHIGELIKAKAKELGFDECGFAKVAPVNEKHQQRFSQWIDRQYNAGMQYMLNYNDKRLDPSLLVPGAKTVISLAINYHQKNHQPEDAWYRISQYAAGMDYHHVVKKKLFQLLEFIRTVTKTDDARVFTDSAPVLERYWAQQAGIGSPGKNSNLIIPLKGSYFFLAEIITDVELPYDKPHEKDLCGTCTRCMVACPTKAITEPGVIDSRKCISYLTIELKDNLPTTSYGNTARYIFGCDICQNVCPHNTRFASQCTEPDFTPLEAIKQWSKSDWEKLHKNTFRKHFIKTLSPLTRVSYEKLMASIAQVKGNPNT